MDGRQRSGFAARRVILVPYHRLSPITRDSHKFNRTLCASDPPLASPCGMEGWCQAPGCVSHAANVSTEPARLLSGALQARHAHALSLVAGHSGPGPRYRRHHGRAHADPRDLRLHEPAVHDSRPSLPHAPEARARPPRGHDPARRQRAGACVTRRPEIDPGQLRDRFRLGRPFEGRGCGMEIQWRFSRRAADHVRLPYARRSHLVSILERGADAAAAPGRPAR